MSKYNITGSSHPWNEPYQIPRSFWLVCFTFKVTMENTKIVTKSQEMYLYTIFKISLILGTFVEFSVVYLKFYGIKMFMELIPFGETD